MSGINFEWHDQDKTILVQSMSGAVTNDEFMNSIDTLISMVQSVPHTIYLVSISNQDVKPGGAVLRVMEAAIKKTLSQPNVGFIFPVGDNLFLRTLMNVIIRYKGWQERIIIVSTLAEALKIIEKHKSSAHNQN